MSLVLTDEQAMWRLQTQEDEAAFARLLERWQEPVRRLCTRMTGDAHLADDLAQETFARVFLHRGEFRNGARFSTWIWRIALNLCHDAQRRRQRRPEDPLPDVPHAESIEILPAREPAPDEAAAGRDLAGCVRQALLALPEHHRSVLLLRHFEDLKFREIAEVLQIPEGTVKSRMAEALTQLARRLGPFLDGTTLGSGPLPCPILLSLL